MENAGSTPVFRPKRKSVLLKIVAALEAKVLEML